MYAGLAGMFTHSFVIDAIYVGGENAVGSIPEIWYAWWQLYNTYASVLNTWAESIFVAIDLRTMHGKYTEADR